MRRYYSRRTGRSKLSLSDIRPLFLRTFKHFEGRGYFQQSFGYFCVDRDWVEGDMGPDPANTMALLLRKVDLWPVAEKCLNYSREDLFDVSEFLFDHCSEPIAQQGDYHGYNECGYHYSQFNQPAGKRSWQRAINELLPDLEDGYKLLDNGEVVQELSPGLNTLVDVTLPTQDPNVMGPVSEAISDFRRRGATAEDRTNAVRRLADVLEYLRPGLRTVLVSKDEQDLFNIANNFGIRHHNQRQKLEYDRDVWNSWMFHYWLATIHASVRILNRSKS